MKTRFFLPNNTPTRLIGTHFQPSFRAVMLGLIVLLAMDFSSLSAHAQTYTKKILHSFSNTSTDGSFPDTTPISVNGILYGTTNDGGANNLGTIYSFDSSTGAVTTLYSFGATTSDGSVPIAGLLNVNGILYGATLYGGGDNNAGTVFSFDPATKTEQTLYSFGNNGTTDGQNPYGDMILVNNILYGTTHSGGTSSKGTIFSFDPFTQVEKTLHSFGATTSDGAIPLRGLLNVNGILYGTTKQGGAPGFGTLFSFDPVTSTEHILHTFTGTSLNGDGADPIAGLINVNGTLYGTTSAGGDDNEGTIFSVIIVHTVYQVIYSFTGSGGDGASPFASLINVNGTLYGTTREGGITNHGTVFAIDPSTYLETTLYRFQGGADGNQPFSSILNINGIFYGTTESGGTSNDGTLFSLTPVTVPTAKNDAGRGIANHTITVTAPGVLGNDNNGGDPNTTAAIVANPIHGTLNFHPDGSFTYTPNTGFVGLDSFTYKDTNSVGTSNTATCNLSIGPIAYNDAGRTYFNTPITINAPGVLANDVTGGLATTASLVTNPSHGTITFNSNGGFTYTPTNGFQGTDTFTYKITSAGGTSAPATCTMTVQARTPVANNDAGRVTHNNTLTITAPGVLGNDNPGTNTGVTAAIVTNPTHGTLTFNSNGSFVYKPTTGFIGTDSFTYKDTNSVGTSNTATCTLTVQ